VVLEPVVAEGVAVKICNMKAIRMPTWRESGVEKE